MPRNMLIAALAIIVFLGAGVYLVVRQHIEDTLLTSAGTVATTTIATSTAAVPDSSTTTPAANPPSKPPVSIRPYGTVTLSIGETAVFKAVSITPLSIEEDSRCPQDVQCIQAGTVRVKVQVKAAMGSNPSILALGKPFTAEGEAITLAAVSPDKYSKTQTATGEYRLTFNVVPQGTASKSTGGKCYVGGCSAQLCTDTQDALSTCIYDSKFACYKAATCERQNSGECGWTPTPELSACLANS